MTRPEGQQSTRPDRLQTSLWVFGAVALSVLLGNVCIMLGAMLAMLFELGVPRTAGIAVNWVAFILMMCLYSVALFALSNAAMRHSSMPFAVWPALGVYPLVWSALVALPGEAYGITPAIVTGIGAMVVWTGVWGGGRRDPAAVRDGSLPR